MQTNKNDVESLKNENSEQEEFQHKLEPVNILFLDISSSCTGYCIATVDFMKSKAVVKKAGCLWLPSEWSHQEKYCYMAAATRDYFWVVERIDYIVAEQYSVNRNKMMGVNVVSEIQGAIKAAAWENGVKVSSILPQTWRSKLKIKGVKKKTPSGKTTHDYKNPTKKKVLENVAVPETVTSNITHKERKTPTDVYDAIGICMGWLTKLGIKTTIFDQQVNFNSHIGMIEKN